MILKLRLQNFQSHPESVLEFVPGVNVITGPTDSGKTSIIRALRLLAWNRPGGDAFRSNWGGDTMVEGQLENRQNITRLKGKENLYKLNGTEFKAFGAAVPDEIQKALNFNDINLQQQLDAPFLLTESPGEVALHFNRIAHLEKIDLGRRNVEQWLRQIDNRLQARWEQLKEAEENLEKFTHLEKLETQIEVLEKMEADWLQSINNARKITRLLEDVKQVDEQVQAKSEVTRFEPQVNAVVQNIQHKEEKANEHRGLQNLIAEIQDVDQQLEATQRLTAWYAPVTQALEITVQIKKLNRTITAAQQTDSQLEQKMERLDALEKEFHDEFPDVCPLCGLKQ